MDTKDRLIQTATKLFFKLGLRRVTMDDIAKECGVSKKTIYQHFKDKSTIIAEITQSYFQKEAESHDCINAAANDPIEELVMISRKFRELLNTMDNTILHDMNRYYPKSWEHFVKHKQSKGLESIKRNLEKGIALGLYRKEINPNILANYRMEVIQAIFTGDLLANNGEELKTIQMEVFDHFIHGILTLKGKEIYLKHLSEN